jgi:hypothetical protein
MKISLDCISSTWIIYTHTLDNTIPPDGQSQSSSLRVCQALSHSLSHSLRHSLTHSLRHSLSHSLRHSLTHSGTHSLTQALTQSLTQEVAGSVVVVCRLSFTCVCVCVCVCVCALISASLALLEQHYYTIIISSSSIVAEVRAVLQMYAALACMLCYGGARSGIEAPCQCQCKTPSMQWYLKTQH